MVTYLVLNLVFLAAVLGTMRLARVPINWKRTAITINILIVFTAIFDSFIVSLGIVGYDTSKTLGITIGYAPIEDFFYAVLSSILVPAIWRILKP